MLPVSKIGIIVAAVAAGELAVALFHGNVEKQVAEKAMERVLQVRNNNS